VLVFHAARGIGGVSGLVDALKRVERSFFGRLEGGKAELHAPGKSILALRDERSALVVDAAKKDEAEPYGEGEQDRRRSQGNAREAASGAHEIEDSVSVQELVSDTNYSSSRVLLAIDKERPERHR
jgi:hypothetical protein